MKPWLWLPAGLAHQLSPWVMRCLGPWGPGTPYLWNPLEREGLRFPNRLGIAGGVDKDGFNAQDWWSLGAGFVEVGTVTPRPQGPNPGVTVRRDTSHEAVWNRLGFPSTGVQSVSQRLAKLSRPYPAPLFVNLGMNRDTPLEQAHVDYIQVLKTCWPYADGFVVNISSPNTKGLRQLLEPEHLGQLLTHLQEANNGMGSPKPLLLKVSPDLSEEQLRSVLLTGSDLKISGFILTNTTLTRYSGSPFPAEGGVSGRPLTQLSEHCLGLAHKILGHRRKNHLLISTGGVMSPEDVESRLSQGADLVQIYSALIFNGPWFFQKVARYFEEQCSQ